MKLSQIKFIQTGFWLFTTGFFSGLKIKISKGPSRAIFHSKESSTKAHK